MYYNKLRKLSSIEKIHLFLLSYSGKAAIAGFICLIFSILYQTWWIRIEAPFQFMIPLGNILNNISLAIIASTIFYFITVYLPKRHKKKVEEYYIRKWLQQLEFYGKCILNDIGGNETCSIDEFQHNARNIDLKSHPPKHISLREFTHIETWFDYFYNLFYWESKYMKQIEKYGDSIPAEILNEFEKYKQFDNLRTAVQHYDKYYDTYKLCKTMDGFSNIIWLHAHSLTKLPEMYLKHIYD